ncbi:MAG: SAM-dependent methyltransferase, partial [Clostridiales bacterium]|nr:SAM-dependent methyltransferase [Clostridiales bacterium]
GGILLNYDANWYHHLFDEEKRREYEQDRARVSETGMEDHYTCTDIDAMEDIARQVPLSQKMRPQWDELVLRELGFSKIEIDMDVWKQVWSEVEKVNYGSTPMFCVKGIR